MALNREVPLVDACGPYWLVRSLLPMTSIRNLEGHEDASSERVVEGSEESVMVDANVVSLAADGRHSWRLLLAHEKR